MTRKIWIFDIDGVITSLTKESVTKPQILEYLAEELKNQPIAFNTGRSLSWVKKTVVDRLTENVSKEDLENLFVVGEFGSIWFFFDKNGRIKTEKDKSIFYDREFSREVSRIISINFPKSMLFEAKESMISTKIKKGYSLKKYKEDQVKLEIQLKELLAKRHLTEKLEVQSDTIAVNILDKKVGKDFAVGKILDWINTKKLKIDKFITFGDSKSDLDMGEELAKRKQKIELVFVGEEKINKEKYKFPITFTNKKYEEGTLEFLKNFNDGAHV